MGTTECDQRASIQAMGRMGFKFQRKEIDPPRPKLWRQRHSINSSRTRNFYVRELPLIPIFQHRNFTRKPEIPTNDHSPLGKSSLRSLFGFPCKVFRDCNYSQERSVSHVANASATGNSDAQDVVGVEGSQLRRCILQVESILIMSLC